jgi:hypothetical protein
VGLGFGDRISQGELALINLMYELTVWCTSIVSRTPSGEIVHGRNLDYGISGLQNLTATIEFTDGAGGTVFSSTAFVGYVGVLTGMNSEFSVSVDQRGPAKGNTKLENLMGILENVIAGATGGTSVGMFLRDQLEGGAEFENTLAVVADTKMIAPVYIIMGGTKENEAVVVTRDRLSADDEVGEGIWRIDSGDHYWRLETNYDHWVDVPETDNRRDPANACMEALTARGVSTDSVRECLSEEPVLNHGTVYTTLMSASEGYFDTLVRDPERFE